MNSNVQQALFKRLRDDPVDTSVPGSLPVLFFGDLFTARIATVGLNPSHREYLDTKGRELTGENRRFETLLSLGATDRRSLTDTQCDRAVSTMRSYYHPGKPVYQWFRPLNNVLAKMGFSYSDGGVAHLDLVQEATRPTWSALSKVSPTEFSHLKSAGLPFLRWQIEYFPLRCVLCNGRTVFDAVHGMVGSNSLQTGTLKRITWYFIPKTNLNRNLCVFGWNIPLTRPTGLGAIGETNLGELCRGLSKIPGQGLVYRP